MPELEWDQITEHQELQELLNGLLNAYGDKSKLEAMFKLDTWLTENLASCEAVVVQGQMYLSNGDPGYPDEYCDEFVEPGHGPFCAKHSEE